MLFVTPLRNLRVGKRVTKRQKQYWQSKSTKWLTEESPEVAHIVVSSIWE